MCTSSPTWLLHKYGPRPILCLTTRKILQSNIWIGRCWCTRSFLLESFCLPPFVKLFFTCCLWSSFTNVDLILFSSYWFSVMSLPSASACRTAICSSSLFPGSIDHISPVPLSSPTLFFPFARSDSAILSLYAFILAFPVKVLSMIVLIRSRHSSSMWFCRSSMRLQPQHNPDNLQCVREPQCLLTRRRIFSAQRRRSFDHNPWPWRSRSFFVSCDLLRQLQFRSHHLPRSAKKRPSQFVDSQASLSVCLVQLLPRTTPFLVMHKTAPVLPKIPWVMRLANELTLSSPILRNQTFSLQNCAIGFLHLRLILLSSFVFSIFANSHFVHDLRCNTKKPTE